MTDVERSAAVVRRFLPATPDEVFDEWVDPDAFGEWMCPRPARVTKIALDPRVGGRLRIDIEEGGVSFYVAGSYIEFERPRRLRFTWSCSTWADPAVESVVTVTLEPHGGLDTLMTIHHARVPPEYLANHERGWTLIAEQLDHVLRRRLLRPTEYGPTRPASKGV
jgi:uncharacterized protein YndB with AHSA1/START domain